MSWGSLYSNFCLLEERADLVRRAEYSKVVAKRNRMLRDAKMASEGAAVVGSDAFAVLPRPLGSFGWPESFVSLSSLGQTDSIGTLDILFSKTSLDNLGPHALSVAALDNHIPFKGAQANFKAKSRF